jgi:hypothetical protein
MDHTPGKWTSSPTDDFSTCAENAYMTIDLGAVYTTTGATIWHYYGNDRAYCNQKLAVSTTGAFSGEEAVIFDTGACSGWCTFPITCENAEAGTCTPENYGPTEAADGDAYTWDQTPAQYVRHWSGRGQNSGVHFMEIDVYGFVGAPCGGGSGSGSDEGYCEADASDYRGTIAETVTGKTCMDCAAQSPYEHSRTPLNYPEFGLEGEHNYCRNPDGEPTAWCYTTDPASRWEVCDVGDKSADCGPVAPSNLGNTASCLDFNVDSYAFDISSTGTLVETWTQNADDGWVEVVLPFAFPWYGKTVSLCVY